MAEKITGYTSEMCQQAMIDELKELFRDMKFTGQEGEKPLKIFKQFIPSPTDDDDDVDTNRSNFPCIIVSRTSGEVVNEKDPQLVLLQLIICCYDPKTDRQGYEDTGNIIEASCSTSSGSQCLARLSRWDIHANGIFRMMTWTSTTGALST